MTCFHSHPRYVSSTLLVTPLLFKSYKRKQIHCGEMSWLSKNLTFRFSLFIANRSFFPHWPGDYGKMCAIIFIASKHEILWASITIWAACAKEIPELGNVIFSLLCPLKIVELWLDLFGWGFIHHGTLVLSSLHSTRTCTNRNFLHRQDKTQTAEIIQCACSLLANIILEQRCLLVMEKILTVI